MKAWIALVGLWMACTLTCQAQVSLTGSGTLQFPSTSLTGQDATLSATTAPLYVIQWLGQSGGFNLYLSAPALSNSSGRTLPGVVFTARNGTFQDMTTGQTPPIAAETQSTGSLVNSLQVLSIPAGVLNGTYRYLPYTANFQVTIPAEAYQGTYTGQLTATLVFGP